MGEAAAGDHRALTLAALHADDAQERAQHNHAEVGVAPTPAQRVLATRYCERRRRLTTPAPPIPAARRPTATNVTQAGEVRAP